MGLKLSLEIYRSHQSPNLLHERSPSLLTQANDKIFYYPFLSQVPFFAKGSPIVSSFVSHEDISKYLSENSIKNVFSLHSKTKFNGNFSQINWHTLQHGIDSFYEKNFSCDHFYVYTKKWTDLSTPITGSAHKVHEVGLYHFDCNISRDAILSKYSLPKDKKFILFAPLPYNTGSSYFFLKGNRLTKYFLNKRLIRDELRLLEKLNSTLEPLGCEILIKSRFKRFLSQEYSKHGHIFYDESFYPSTINELVSISETVVCNFMPSALAHEALLAGKGYIVVEDLQNKREVDKHVNQIIPGLFNPGGENDFVSMNDFNWVQSLVSNCPKQNKSSRYFSDYVMPLNIHLPFDFTAFLS